jgi:transposase
MRGDLTIRTTRTASGAVAVQVVLNEGKKRRIIQHIGSAHDARTREALLQQAQTYVETHCVQPSLLAQPAPDVLHLTQARLVSVTHRFARDALWACAERCGLHTLPALFVDLALMRIIEPASKLRTVDLLQSYFGVRYAERSVYRLLPKVLLHKEAIETAALQTAQRDFEESLSLVLYDVTTLYFESFKSYDFQKTGFSKDNKPLQPQIVIGLITTRTGFPLMHDVFEGNAFEGHTMMDIVKRFQQRMGKAKLVVVADAAMLSQSNMKELGEKGYRYIVGARLASTTRKVLDQIDQQLPRIDQSTQRFEGVYVDDSVALICAYSEKRFKKDKRELDKQALRAHDLLARKEPGRRAKFVKKANGKDQPFQFDADHHARAAKLLGIKGYVTNIPEAELSNAQVVVYYHELWHVEQAFRMSKADLRTRPIFHHTKDAICAHVLICFMALVMGKYLEIKTCTSLRRIRDALWSIHEATVLDEKTGKQHTLRMNLDPLAKIGLLDLLNLQLPH